jgi:hypothetical protein
MILENQTMTFDYKASMAKGHKYNELVGKRIASEGISCTVPELYLVKDLSEIPDMTKYEKDIILDPIDEVLEVKSRDLWFTDDLRTYPHNNLIVDTVSGYETKEQKPMGYVFVSQRAGGMICLPTYTKDTWEKKVLYDKYRDLHDTFYIASIEQCKPFTALVKHIKDRIDQ